VDLWPWNDAGGRVTGTPAPVWGCLPVEISTPATANDGDSRARLPAADIEKPETSETPRRDRRPLPSFSLSRSRHATAPHHERRHPPTMTGTRNQTTANDDTPRHRCQ